VNDQEFRLLLSEDLLKSSLYSQAGKDFQPIPGFSSYFAVE